MKKIFFALYISMMIALSACAAPTPIILPTLDIAPTIALPSATPRSPTPFTTLALPTLPISAIASPTISPTTAPRPPTLVTGLSLPAFKISAIDGQGFAMNDPIISGVAVAKDYMSFRVHICYPDCKNNRADGKDVKDVNFYFCKSNVNDCRKNNAIFSQTENNPAFCSFGGGEPNCNIIYFNQTDKWPNGTKIENGDYKLSIEAHSNFQNTFWNGTIQFQIRR